MGGIAGADEASDDGRAGRARLRETPVFRTVVGRRSVRGFRPDEVDDEVIDAILAGASRAPSGQNMQLWKVHVVTGSARARLAEEVCAAVARGEPSMEYDYLPAKIIEPYLSRRRKVGFDLFALYGVTREDSDGRLRAYLRNFEFFGAPVGLFFVLDRAMALGSWVDCGAFMQTVMILARAAGLETCPQQAWCDYGAVVHRVLGIPADQILVSGMSLGYMDRDAPANTLSTERSPVHDFTTRHR